MVTRDLPQRGRRRRTQRAAGKPATKGPPGGHIMTQFQALLAPLAITAALVTAAMMSRPATTADPLPLELQAKIPLGDVKGRIDHLAADPKRRRVFIAELGNDTVGIIDLDGRKVTHTISGLKE